jgi:hypothetical protein
MVSPRRAHARQSSSRDPLPQWKRSPSRSASASREPGSSSTATRPYANNHVTSRKVTVEGRGWRPMTTRITTTSMAPDHVKTEICNGP